METMLDLTGSRREVEAILALAKKHGIDQISQPSALDAGRNQNAGLMPGDVKEVLQFITLVFGTGGAALAFLKSLREELAAWKGKVAVSEPASGKALGTVEATTTDKQLEAHIEQP
jgi:hypothetical protein